MIEEFVLPHRMRQAQQPFDSFACPLLPCADKYRKRLRVQFRRAKEMNVIGHDDIAADCPRVAISRQSPFCRQYRSDSFRCEDRFAMVGARRDKIDWLFDPNSLQPTKMLVHASL